jgi:hypothetical protein
MGGAPLGNNHSAISGCDAGEAGEWRDRVYDAALEARGRSAENVTPPVGLSRPLKIGRRK